MPSTACVQIQTISTYFYGAQRSIDHQAIDETVDDVNEMCVCAFVELCLLIAEGLMCKLHYYRKTDIDKLEM